MTTTPTLDDTRIFVKVLMHGLVDKSGRSIFGHCERVMLRVRDEAPDQPERLLVALLHDAVEDTSLTLPDLRRMGYPDRVLAAMDLLTHDTSTTTYTDYIGRILLSGNLDAVHVKLADMKDNLLPWRMDSLPEQDQQWLRSRYDRPFYLLLSEYVRLTQLAEKVPDALPGE